MFSLLLSALIHVLPSQVSGKLSREVQLWHRPALHACLQNLVSSVSPPRLIVATYSCNQYSPIDNPLHLRNLRLLSPILTPCRNPTYNTPQITHSPHKMIPHTRTILASSSPHHNNTMLLHIMSNPWYVRAYHTPRAKAHLGRFALARVRFFGLSNTYF